MPGARSGVSRRPGGVTNGATSGEASKDYAYVEVMACPGGCTNGGGQVKVTEVNKVRAAGGIQPSMEDDAITTTRPGPKEQKEWLSRVDEAYFSDSDSDESRGTTGGISRQYINDVISHWSDLTGVDRLNLLYTSYREVESDVGKKKQSDVERVAGLASSLGGGW